MMTITDTKQIKTDGTFGRCACCHSKEWVLEDNGVCGACNARNAALLAFIMDVRLYILPDLQNKDRGLRMMAQGLINRANELLGEGGEAA